MQIENRKIMKELVEKEKIRLEKIQNRIKNIISNPDYMNWLEQFSLKYPNFNSYEFYFNDKLSKEDKDNSNDLALLYEGISNYAHDNYLYPISDSMYSGYYRIHYNNVGYEIGVIKDQKIITLCKRFDSYDDTFIDFNDIMLNRKQPNTDYITERLQELSNIVVGFYENNIPLRAIKSTLGKTITNLELESQEKLSRKK